MKTPRKSSRTKEADSDATAGENAIAWILKHGGAHRVTETSRSSARRTQCFRLFAGTVAVAMAVTVTLLWTPRPHSAPALASGLPGPALLEAPERQFLSDGSTVEMKDGARIEVDYRTRERRVVLTEGEALFEVISSPDRPFVVTVGQIEVRALGTAFSVSLTEGSVNVLVTKGTVRVDQTVPSAQPHALATVTANNRVSVPKAEALGGGVSSLPVEAVSETEMAELLAWRIPRIEFSGTRLSEALPLINRYSPTRLTLADPSLGDVQLSGSLRPDRVKPLLLLLKNEFGIEGEANGSDEIVLRRNRSNSP